VLFTPDDLSLVSGSPSDRRRYLDVLLCQASREYCHALSQYNRSLLQRNHLLRLIRGRHSDPEQLPYWDQLLAENGAVITTFRGQALSALRQYARAIHGTLAPGQDLAVAYMPGTACEATSSALCALYGSCRRRDLERGITTQGPHRDDFSLMLDGLDVAGFGSRGQMRTIALTLRLAEAAYLTERLGTKPLLLLDDVMSELDVHRRRALEQAMMGTPQSFVTDLDQAPFSPAFLAVACLLRVRDGHASRVNRDARDVAEQGPFAAGTGAG
jgi:DNA replication and repair protein RecF